MTAAYKNPHLLRLAYILVNGVLQSKQQKTCQAFATLGSLRKSPVMKIFEEITEHWM